MALPNVLSITGELRSANPTTGAVMRTFVMDSNAALETKLSLARSAFQRWRLSPFAVIDDPRVMAVTLT